MKRFFFPPVAGSGTVTLVYPACPDLEGSFEVTVLLGLLCFVGFSTLDPISARSRRLSRPLLVFSRVAYPLRFLQRVGSSACFWGAPPSSFESGLGFSFVGAQHPRRRAPLLARRKQFVIPNPRFLRVRICFSGRICFCRCRASARQGL